MRNSRAQEISVAVTSLLALLLFAGAVLVLGQENRLFARKTSYTTNFPDAAGLRVGSPVTLAGVRVGTVKKIVLPRSPQAHGIDVIMQVDEAYSPRVREGTKAKQVTLQFIANEKAIELSPGDPEKPELPDGAEIPAQVEQEILETGRSIADTLEQITIDLQGILTSIKNKEGLVGRAILDPEFGKKGLAELEGAMSSANSLLARIDRGDGLLGKALVDQALSARVSADLQTAAHGFAAVAKRLDAGQGLIGQLTSDASSAEMGRDLQAALGAFRGLAEALDRGDGWVGALLSDRARADRILANLDASMQRLASITRKIDEGQGTLGLLVNDRKLHDSIQTLVIGSSGNTVAGKVIRHYYKKGTKAGPGAVPPAPSPIPDPPPAAPPEAGTSPPRGSY